jgi:hypothetical protein
MSLTRNLLTGAAAVALGGGTAMADEPVQLTDLQMDSVTAGYFLQGQAETGGFFTDFGGAVANAEVGEESKVKLSFSDSFSAGSGGMSGSSSASAEAEASIAGSFETVLGGGIMETGGTFAFASISPIAPD